MDPHDIAFRLGTALLFGGIIGFERQWHQRMGGAADQRARLARGCRVCRLFDGNWR